MSGEHFSRVITLLDDLVTECRTLPVQDGGIADCVELIERLKNAGISMDGLKAALLGRVTSIQNEVSVDTGIGDTADDAASECLGPIGRDRTLLKLVERTGRQSYWAAAKETHASQFAAMNFPQFVEAMRQGAVSVHYLEVLGMVGRTAALTELAQENEELLLEWAQHQNVKEFRRSVKRWERENGFKAARRARGAGRWTRRETFRLYPEDDGYKVSGWLTAESGSVVIRALRHESRVIVDEEQARKSAPDRHNTGGAHCASGHSASGHSASGQDANPDGANPDGANARGVSERGVSGHSVNGQDANPDRASWHATTTQSQGLSGVNPQTANSQHSSFRDASSGDANLHDGSTTHANLPDVDPDSANLREGFLTDANLHGSSWSDANSGLSNMGLSNMGLSNMHDAESNVVDLWGREERNARALVRILRQIWKANRGTQVVGPTLRNEVEVQDFGYLKFAGADGKGEQVRESWDHIPDRGDREPDDIDRYQSGDVPGLVGSRAKHQVSASQRGYRSG